MRHRGGIAGEREMGSNEPPPTGEAAAPLRRCRTPFAPWAVLHVAAIFGAPLAAVVALGDLVPEGRVARLAATAAAPFLYVVGFVFAAGLLSIPHRRHVVPGSFPRDLRLPAYRGRRLY